MFLAVAETIVGLHYCGMGIVQGFFQSFEFTSLGHCNFRNTRKHIFCCFFSPHTLASPAWLTANLGFNKVECLISPHRRLVHLRHCIEIKELLIVDRLRAIAAKWLFLNGKGCS